jgi:hypothetical protein
MTTTKTTRKQWQRIKQAVRDKYAWPGGYPLYIVMQDGDALSIDAAKANWKLLCRAYVSGDTWDGWYAHDADINYEDPQLYCCDTNKRIESAYAEDDAESDFD